MPGQPNLEERLRGFKEVLNIQPGIKIVDIVDIKGDPSAAFDKAQRYTALTGSQKIDAFVCLEAVSGKPVADAIKRAKLHDRELITWDADPGTLDAIKDGTIDATIAQKPYTMSLVGLHMLDDLYHNKLPKLDSDWSRDSFAPIPAFVDTGTAVIDKSNIKAFREAKEAAIIKRIQAGERTLEVYNF